MTRRSRKPSVRSEAQRLIAQAERLMKPRDPGLARIWAGVALMAAKHGRAS